MSGLEIIKDILEIVSQIAVAIGIPTVAYQFWQDRRDREYGTFDALDEKYVEFQRICIEYPELDIHDIPFESDPPRELTVLDVKREEAALWILMALFERAFLMYQRHPRKVRRSQFDGWVTQMRQWGERENFRRAWAMLEPGDYDRDFMRWFQSEILAKPAQG